MLRIGVDVSSLVQEITGIGRYLSENLKYFDSLEVHWIFYSHAEIDVSYLKQISQKSIKIIPYFPKRNARIFWTLFFLPWMARNDRLDCFWFPSHRVPFFFPRSVPLACTIHDLVSLEMPESMDWKTKALDRVLLPFSIYRAERLIAVSEQTRVAMTARFPICEPKTVVIHEGASESLVAHLHSANALTDYIVNDALLVVGTIEPRKNVRLILEAYANLPRPIRQKHKLVFIGKVGWGGIQPSLIAAELGIQNDFVFITKGTDSLLRGYYERSFALVFVSKYEGFGLPIVEAMANGLPMVLSDLDVFKEVAKDCALYCDTDSSTSLTNAILKLCGSKSLQKDLSQRSKKRVRLFKWQNFSIQLQKVLIALARYD